MRLWFIFAGVGAIVLSACAGPSFIGRSDLAFVEQSALPPPTRADLSSHNRPFVIGPRDHLAVDVYGLADLSRNVVVDTNGQIALPLVGRVDVAGMTPTELSDLVTERLRAHHVRDPVVTVNMTQTVSQMVTVDGAVQKPGMYPIAGRMTLMRAVATAEGVTEYARTNHVVVFRMVDGRQMAALYDMRAIRLGAYEDPEIFSNDVVVVGDSPARRIFRDVLQSSGLLLSPVVAILNRR